VAILGDTTRCCGPEGARGGKPLRVGIPSTDVYAPACCFLLGSQSARPADREITVPANANGGRRVGRILSDAFLVGEPWARGRLQ